MKKMLVLLAGQSNMSGRGYLTEEDVKVIPGITALRRDGVWIPAADPFNYDRINALGLNDSTDPFEEKALDVNGKRRTRWFDVQVRVHKDFRLEMHVDTDDANAAGIGNGFIVTVVK